MADWSFEEDDLIIADYFRMLSLELAGKRYSKAEHRRDLLKLLNDRSHGSIEFKHQNISAILINLGQPYIKGYAPRYNYQRVLAAKIIEYLTYDRNIERQFQIFAEDQGEYEINKRPTSFLKFLVEPPVIAKKVNHEVIKTKSPIKIDYLEREQQNSSLGIAGEELVLKFEKWNLQQMGRDNLADQIRWVSKEDGDGAGFDILSKNLNGTDKYLEVKTTKLSKESPFYFTYNELDFSNKKSKDYHLYRVFNFNDEPKMFIKNGRLDEICHSTPINFKGSFS